MPQDEHVHEQPYTLDSLLLIMESDRAQLKPMDPYFLNEAVSQGDFAAAMAIRRADALVFSRHDEIIGGLQEMKRAGFRGSVSVPVEGSIYPRVMEQIRRWRSAQPRNAAMDRRIVNPATDSLSKYALRM